jgi:hypothetical protein
MNHYIEIAFSKKVNPVGFVSTILHRIHGFQTRVGGVELAIDFPAWINPGRLMPAQIGHSMRVFGSREALVSFLKGTGLANTLLEEGIDFKGIAKVPDTVSGYASVRRNQKIKKLIDILAKPNDICDFSPKGEITLEARNIAKKLGVTAQKLVEVERLLHELHVQKRGSVQLNMRSKSSQCKFGFSVFREMKKNASNDAVFSTYGLAKGNGCVPYWD